MVRGPNLPNYDARRSNPPKYKKNNRKEKMFYKNNSTVVQRFFETNIINKKIKIIKEIFQKDSKGKKLTIKETSLPT